MSQIEVELQAVYGSDKEVAESAWTSSLTHQGKQKRSDEDVRRVVNMLADAKHSTPFESVIFRWWIKMPIAIDRQFMTHRLQSASGMSGRYRTMPNDFLTVPEDIQNILFRIKEESQMRQYYNLCEDTNNFYQSLIDDMKSYKNDDEITNDEYKRIREFFRGVLPQHNMTERVSVMNLRSWCNFYRLRSKSDAQPEIQIIANKMKELIINYPNINNSIQALEKNNWVI